MNPLKKIISKFLTTRVIRFASASAIATLVDILLFRFVFYQRIELFYAEISAAFIGMIVNFILQKYFVFNSKRKTTHAFFLSFAFSLVTITIGGSLMTMLVKIPFFAAYILAAKLIVVAFKFGINFITKRWVFEKRWK